MKELDVVVIGNLVADLIAKPVDVEKMPARGSLQEVERMEFHLGGISNTAIALAKLGVKVGFIGKVGEDALGHMAKTTLKEHGIDTSAMLLDPDTGTSATMALVDDGGERTFLHYLGGNAILGYNDVMLILDYIRQAKFLHIGYFGLLPTMEPELAHFFREVKQKNKIDISIDIMNHPDLIEPPEITISLDTGGSFRKLNLQKLSPALTYTDIFVPSFEEAKAITGRDHPTDIVDTFASCGKMRILGVKMGTAGSFLKSEDATYMIPPFPVDVVDTLGCGDAFYAGLLVGQLKGYDLYSTGRFANAVGACCAEAVGASAGIKNLQETLAFMEETPQREE